MKPFNFDLTGTEATPVTNTTASLTGSQAAPAKSGVMSSMSSFFSSNNKEVQNNPAAKFLFNEQMTGKNLRPDVKEEASPLEETKDQATPVLHQILLTTIYNKVILLHANPAQGKIHIFELDPQFVYKY